MKKMIIAAAALFAVLNSSCTTSRTSMVAESDTPAPIERELPVLDADYAPTGWLATSLPQIAEALKTGEVTAEALVGAYLERIDRIDNNGPTLQSVLTINPKALEDARALDAMRAAGEPLGVLHGVPILLKDNIETLDPMPTTAGALALKDNFTGRDSPLVAGLRAAGAIVLGKTNLSQWANFRSNESMSGWSALGGQVRNPHMLDRNPCGSSSGSGAAVAASLAAGAVGTETNGSIICPSNVNGVVGFKPTVGLVSQQYIVPISSSQDTAGPMTKTVKGAAMMLSAMATGGEKIDYMAALDAGSLQGKRVGVLRYAQGQNEAVIALFNAALKELERAGAELVEIDAFRPDADGFGGKSYNLLKYEFKATLDSYLANSAPAVKVRSLKELIAFNELNASVELVLFDQDILVASDSLGGLEDSVYVAVRDELQRSTRERGIDSLLTGYRVDVLVSPSGPVAPRIDPVNGDVWPSWAGAGSLAAIAGYPHLTVPMGTVHGVPVGFSFIGGRNQDGAMLSYGYAFEQRTNLRAQPLYLSNAEERPEIGPAMKRK